MTPPLTTETEAELRALEQAATPGPWMARNRGSYPDIHGSDSGDCVATVDGWRGMPDAALIAAMRNHLVPLLDALERWRTHFNEQSAKWAATNVALREERDEARQECETWHRLAHEAEMQADRGLAVAGAFRADAELGRLLREAREAWGDPGLTTHRSSTGVGVGRWASAEGRWAFEAIVLPHLRTEPDALRAAIKAAPESKDRT